MRSEEEVRRLLERYTSPENSQLLIPAYIRGVIDALKWVLEEPKSNEPLSRCEAWLQMGRRTDER